MICGILAAIIRLLTGVKQTHLPLHNEGSYLFYGNHSSHLDFLVIWAALPPSIREHTVPVAAKDYWSKGIIRPWLAQKVFNAILLSRGGRGEAKVHPLQPIFDAMAAGKSIIIFPEGTRSLDGNMKPFKPGIYHLAHKFPEFSLVPVVLNNLTKILPKGEILPIPLIATARFLEPTRLGNEDKQTFLTRIHQAISQHLTE